MKYLTLIAVLFSFPLHAVDITTAEGIHIKSDFTTADFKNEVTEYNGNVIVTQENFIYEADAIKEYRNNKLLTKLVGTGKPTVFINKLAVDGELASGTATKVTYVAVEGKVYLEGYKLTDVQGNTQTSERGVFLLSE